MTKVNGYDTTDFAIQPKVGFNFRNSYCDIGGISAIVRRSKLCVKLFFP